RPVLPEGRPDRAGERRVGALRLPEPHGDGPPLPPARALVLRAGQAGGAEPQGPAPQGHGERPGERRAGDPVEGGQPGTLVLPLPHRVAPGGGHGASPGGPSVAPPPSRRPPEAIWSMPPLS